MKVSQGEMATGSAKKCVWEACRKCCIKSDYKREQRERIQKGNGKSLGLIDISSSARVAIWQLIPNLYPQEKGNYDE